MQALRDDVIALKRERILATAVTLFYEQGYRQTSVEAIAERLGATKPFVYYHFRSKLELLTAICESGTGDALEAIDRATRAKGPAAARLEGLVRSFARMALKNHRHVAIYFREETNLPADASARIEAMRASIHRRLKTLLAQGASAGEFLIDDPGVSALVIAGMASYAFAWYRDGGRLDLDEATEQIVAMAMKLVGVAPAGSAASDARAAEMGPSQSITSRRLPE